MSMSENSEKIEEYSLSSQTTLDEFVEVLEVLIGNSENITKDNEFIGHELFSNMAKLDHMVFKNNAYASMFAGKVDFDVTTYTECQFGKWYESEGKEQFGNQVDFKKMQTPHKEVHEAIKKAMSLIGTDKIDEIIQHFRDAEEASKELFISLDHLVKEK